MRTKKWYFALSLITFCSTSSLLAQTIVKEEYVRLNKFTVVDSVFLKQLEAILPVDSTRIFSDTLPIYSKCPWHIKLLNEVSRQPRRPLFYFFAVHTKKSDDGIEVGISMDRSINLTSTEVLGFFKIREWIYAIFNNYDPDIFMDTGIKDEVQYKEQYRIINGEETLFTPTEEFLSWKMEYMDKKLLLKEFGFNIY